MKTMLLAAALSFSSLASANELEADDSFLVETVDEIPWLRPPIDPSDPHVKDLKPADCSVRSNFGGGYKVKTRRFAATYTEACKLAALEVANLCLRRLPVVPFVPPILNKICAEDAVNRVLDYPYCKIACE